ncbi:DUF3667 domain-containing protein [Pseudomarimonas arenosa]|uniref:DUF3667 domain-containing protein n=1 Tax=Pseudomarimonas arenosa TaxID=2774145 RepID=A0AAW3ZGC8_9GAMM|nr:DUF3667 domain-containing protein [Pseudomarimonas arenosa]MBD8524903.1 DUF3667 domain-containing protein [Pseudomarimonas arenosa]
MSSTEPARPARLDARQLLSEWGQELFSLDRGLLWTIAQLVVRPGQLIRLYVDWRDPRIVRPSRLLLVLFAIAALMWQADGVGEDFFAGFFGQLEASHMNAQVIGAAQWVLNHFSLLLTLLWAPATGGAVQQCYRSLNLNLAESLVFGLYTLCLFVPLQLLVWVLVAWAAEWVYLIYLLPLLVITHAAYGYARADGFGWARALLCGVLAQVVLFLGLLSGLFALAAFAHLIP